MHASAQLRGISSMATRQLLGCLAEHYAARGLGSVAFESVGGVDAARRVQAGEPFDVVVLASDALEKLVAGGHVVQGSVVPVARSEVAIAVQAGSPRPPVATADELRAALLAAPTVGYSTGPSGTALLALLDRWAIRAALEHRLVQAPAGHPVGCLVAEGKVALGFQQLSELAGLPGIDILGPMPPGCEIITIFAGGVAATCTRPEEARRLLTFLRAPETAAEKQRLGMDAA